MLGEIPLLCFVLLAPAFAPAQEANVKVGLLIMNFYTGWLSWAGTDAGKLMKIMIYIKKG